MSLLKKISSNGISISTIPRYQTLQNVNNRRRPYLAQHILTPIAYTSASQSVWRKSLSFPHLFEFQGNNVLWIDLGMFQYGRKESLLYSVDVKSTNWEPSEELPKMMEKLKQFVKADALKPSSRRIDSVQWYVARPYQPTAKMWRALDGLSPKHLQIVAPYDGIGECKIKALNLLQSQWSDLETLCLINMFGAYDLMKHAPDIFSRISSLTLHYCAGASMIPPRAARLKHLRILGNNACDMFIYGWENNPHFAEVLDVLEVKSTGGVDFDWEWEPQDFRERLLKCANLREFRFVVSHHDGLDADLGVGSYIPASVEKLELQFTRSLPFLHKFGDWINHASDPAWLPNLKSFQLTVDPKSRVSDFGKDDIIYWDGITRNAPHELSPEEFDREFEEQRSVLYDLLKTRRPSIELV